MTKKITYAIVLSFLLVGLGLVGIICFGKSKTAKEIQRGNRDREVKLLECAGRAKRRRRFGGS